MSVTWKDGVTTLSVAGAIALERAHFHNWDWPLVSNVRWVIVGLALLFAISLAVSYVLDRTHSTIWTWTASILTFAAVLITGLGLVFAESQYVVLLMVTAVIFWAASLIAHLTVRNPSAHGPTYA